MDQQQKTSAAKAVSCAWRKAILSEVEQSCTAGDDCRHVRAEDQQPVTRLSDKTMTDTPGCSLESNPLLDRKPVQLVQHGHDMMVSFGCILTVVFSTKEHPAHYV